MTLGRRRAHAGAGKLRSRARHHGVAVRSRARRMRCLGREPSLVVSANARAERMRRQMADAEMTLGALRQLIAEFVHEREWEQFHNPKDLAAAIAIEASELQELLLWKTPGGVEEFVADPERSQALHEELADVLIFSFCLANRLGIDVADSVRAKLRRN